LILKQLVSCGESRPGQPNPSFSFRPRILGLEYPEKGTLTFWRLRWGLGKEEGRSNPSQRMPPRQRSSRGTNVPPTASEPVGENEEVSRQGGGIPLVEQEVVSEQRHARQEPDLMARMTAMLKDLEQEVRLLKEGRTQEVRDDIPPTGHQDGAHPEGGSAVGGRANPQYLTLADVNALLEQEREKLSGIPKQFSRDPPFPPELLGKPYPKGYEPPKFHPFDGRNGSAVEHVSRFVHTMGPYAGDKELCLREFAKSLVDRAYTWYTTLRPGSIKTWDEMMEKFCAKYYPGEDKITFQNANGEAETWRRSCSIH